MLTTETPAASAVSDASRCIQEEDEDDGMLSHPAPDQALPTQVTRGTQYRYKHHTRSKCN